MTLQDYQQAIYARILDIRVGWPVRIGCFFYPPAYLLCAGAGAAADDDDDDDDTKSDLPGELRTAANPRADTRRTNT